MHVHVVCREIGRDGILERLAQGLVNGQSSQWTVGPSPDRQADVNHFASYIEFAEFAREYGAFTSTPTSAYFTHYEQGTVRKEQWWEYANEHVGLRLTSASMYLPYLAFPAALVRPPIDPMFRPAQRHKAAVPVVGVSGFVDRRSGRKGEHLLERLAASHLGRQVSIVGTGHGWPVPTRRRKISELPAFYQSLDVYLCTSLVEGVPMPPLEALACGIPIVIPIGVGLLDEFPDMPGIHRYPAGEYEALEAALRECFQGDYDPEQLRSAVAQYTPENWIADHESAFDAWLLPAVSRPPADFAPPVSEPVSIAGDRGVYYVAYGKPARQCAAVAMASFKQHVPDVPVALCATSAIGPEDGLIDAPDADIGGRSAKTRIYELAPANWRYVLYLDADTEVVANIAWLFKPLVDGWDLVICKNPARFHLARFMRRDDNAEECEYTFELIGSDELFQFNGGVFAFRRNERTAAFFHCWHEEWQRYGKRDQGALLRALWRYPVRLFILTNHWNTIPTYVQGDPLAYTAGILHHPMTARRWEGLVGGRLDSLEAWDKVRQWEKGQQW